MARIKTVSLRNAGPCTIELVGPAGAGKTTLLHALRRRSNKIRVGVSISKLRYLSSLTKNTVFLLATFIRHYRQTRWFTWGETRAMVYLTAWHEILDRQQPDVDRVTVLDHGPIFRLALLREFGPEITRSHQFEKWWNDILNQWAGTLDVIIWLDAPDDILLQRILSRSCGHRVKNQSAEEAKRFLACYRNSYEQIIAKMKATHGPMVFCFDTNQVPADQVVEAVISALDRGLDVTFSNKA